MTDAKKGEGEDITVTLTHDDCLVINLLIDSYINTNEKEIVAIEDRNISTSIQLTRAIFEALSDTLRNLQAKILDGVRSKDDSASASPSVLDKFWTGAKGK